MIRAARAVAHPNIALAKYWGKRDVARNIPATPSISVTLSGLTTETEVTFDDALPEDEFWLGGQPMHGRELRRLVGVLDEVRLLAGKIGYARVVSHNDFPTASGLASSASGFAALVTAACAAVDLDIDLASKSRMARRASASAARSMLGGFVRLGTDDDPAAEQIAPSGHWDLSVVVAAVNAAVKETGSTDGMEHTRKTSPYYEAWIQDAPKVAAEIHEAVCTRDLDRLGRAAEVNAFRMHACALAAAPPVTYWTGATLDLLAAVRALRRDGVSAWATIDAGPHVKVLCTSDDAPHVAKRLTPHAARVILAEVGQGARQVPEGTPSRRTS